MVKYNLLTLESEEFQSLSVDLYSKIEGKDYSNTNVGSDGGIDGYFYIEGKKKNILQAKRYSTKSKLKTDMKKEKLKMDKIQKEINKYILFTSCKLQSKDKEAIFKIMKPYIKNVNDIYDYSDILTLISNYPSIELKYNKLWLPSSNVLFQSLILIVDRTFNKKIYEITKLHNEKKDEIIKKYVNTKYLDEALKIVENKGVLIISGMPYVGKTTLAYIICYLYENRKYEFVNIDKIDDYLSFNRKKNKRYIFFFDDFLGDIEYNISDEKETKKIIQVIEKFSRDQNDKLIITTREMVLNDGKSKSNSIDNFNLDLLKITVNIKEYTKEEKLQILIRHIDYYSVSLEQIRKFINDKKLLKIINHEHYFPKIVDQTFKYYNQETDDLVDEIILNLDDCHRIWKNIFENAVDTIEFKILAYLYFGYNNLDSNDLAKEMDLYGLTYDETINSIKRLERNLNLLKLIRQNNGKLIIEFFDPSIRDYLRKHIFDNFNSIRFMINEKTNQNILSSILYFYNIYTSLRENYSDIYNWFNKYFLDSLEKKINEDNIAFKEKSYKPKNYYSYNRMASFYNLLTITDNNMLKKIFNILIKDETDNYYYLEIYGDISLKINDDEVNEFCNRKLDEYIENIDDNNYYIVVDWKEFIEKHEKSKKLKEKIVEYEEAIPNDCDDEWGNVSYKIDRNNETISYLEELNNWYDDSPLCDAISKREEIISSLNDKNTDNEDLKDKNTFKKDSAIHNESSDDEILIEQFIEHYNL